MNKRDMRSKVIAGFDIESKKVLKTEKFHKADIGKKIVYWPIEDAEKRVMRKLMGTIVERDEFDEAFVKVFTGKKLVDVHVGQMLNIL